MAIEHNSLSDDNRLEALQETIKSALGETTFGKPTEIVTPGGQTLVFRRRQNSAKPDSAAYSEDRANSRKAVSKRSKAMGESWKKFVEPGKKTLIEDKSSRRNIVGSSSGYESALVEKFPLAYELVEYVSGGGTVNNMSKMMQLKPPTLHSIEDVTDAVDWHLLNRGINVEHLETALSKDGSKVLVFMDDRAKPRLPQIKEVLSKFGEARILQRADDISEQSGQPQGFYVFELEPDSSLYQPTKTEEPNPKALDWNPDKPQPEMVDSQDADYEDVILEDVVLEDIYEPFCSTCGEQLLESDPRHAFKPSTKLADADWTRKQKRSAGKKNWKLTSFAAESQEDVQEAKGKLHPKMLKYMSSEAFDAKVGDPKGKKRKDHPSTIGDSVDTIACVACGTDATLIDEHEFQGYFCARHGDKLDKYSHACYECQSEAKVMESVSVACPECKSETTLDESECSVCGTAFDDGVADYAEYVAETIAPFEVDEDITSAEHDWGNNYATELADTLFGSVEEELDDPF